MKDTQDNPQAAALQQPAAQSAARHAPTAQEPPGQTWAQMILRWSNVGVIILLFAISSLLSRYFLTVRNVMNILRGTSMMGITALGMTVVILNRGVDLSVGSVAGLSSVLAAGLQPRGVWLAWGVALVVAVLLGFTLSLIHI